MSTRIIADQVRTVIDPAKLAAPSTAPTIAARRSIRPGMAAIASQPIPIIVATVHPADSNRPAISGSMPVTPASAAVAR